MAVLMLGIEHRNLTCIIAGERNTGLCQLFLMCAGHGHSAGETKSTVFVSQPGIGSVWTSERAAQRPRYCLSPGLCKQHIGSGHIFRNVACKTDDMYIWVLMELEPERTHPLFYYFRR